MMFSSITILDWWVNPEQATGLPEGAQNEAITVAAQLTMPHIE